MLRKVFFWELWISEYLPEYWGFFISSLSFRLQFLLSLRIEWKEWWEAWADGCIVRLREQKEGIIFRGCKLATGIVYVGLIWSSRCCYQGEGEGEGEWGRRDENNTTRRNLGERCWSCCSCCSCLEVGNGISFVVVTLPWSQRRGAPKWDETTAEAALFGATAPCHEEEKEPTRKSKQVSETLEHIYHASRFIHAYSYACSRFIIWFHENPNPWHRFKLGISLAAFPVSFFSSRFLYYMAFRELMD